MSVDEAAVLAQVDELLRLSPEARKGLTLPKVLFGYGFLAERQGFSVEESAAHALLFRVAWEAVEESVAAQEGRPRPLTRLVLNDEPEGIASEKFPEAVAPVIPILTDDQLIERYDEHQRRCNLTPRTISSRTGSLKLFAKIHGRGLGTVTRQDVERVFDEQERKARSTGRSFGPRRRAWWLSCLKVFYDWAVDEGLLTENPVARIRRPHLDKTLPRPMSEADLWRAIDEAPEPMIKCWVLLGALGGLRCQEIAGLDREDVLEADGLLRVVHGKGRKERMVPLHPDVLAALQALPMPASGALFRRRRLLTRYPPAQLVQELNLYLHSIGVKSTAHSLRHYFGTKVHDETHDLRLTQELLGHNSPETTAIYTKVNPAEAVKAVTRLTIGPSPGVA